MKIFDCFMYFDEDLLLDLRLNSLDSFVKKFVIAEATYTHNGTKKKLNFDINKFKKFKDKINYIVVEKQPQNILELKEKLQDSGMVEAAKAKKAATEKVMEAMSPRKLRKAFKAYRAEYGFPEEPGMLNKLLESDDEDLLVEVMETVDRLIAADELKVGPALKARIKSAMILVDAPEVQTLGQALLKKLR